MRQLLRGAGDVARGFRFLTAHPRLWWWVLAPAIVTLVFIVAIIWTVLVVSAPLVAMVTGWAPDFMEPFAGALLRVLAVAGLSVVGFLVYVSLSGLFAGPFCEMLSEEVEERVTGTPSPPFSLFAFLRGLVLGILHAVRRLAVYLFAIGLALAAGSVVPVIGHALGIGLAGYFAATTAAWDCYDSIFGRRLWRYRQKQEYLRANRGRALGLGAAVAALLLIPFCNLVALGIGSIGATLAYLDREGAARR
ncbi:MAG TPA: EI24 domain-containing protein [Kofleriaceae bacterium]|nr:EI24 domain-containing protein [Kofleriaceae bacterium]